MRHLCEDSSLPILIGGDDEILNFSEKEGGTYRPRLAMTSFREVIDDLSLCDLGFIGDWCTWERGKSASNRIRERLDHFLCSRSWLDIFPDTTADHLLRYKSDHSPILTQCHPCRRQRIKRKGFRFQSCWLLDETCEATVRAGWQSSVGEDMKARLTLSGHDLAKWSSSKFSQLDKQIKKTEKLLSEA